MFTTKNRSILLDLCALGFTQRIAGVVAILVLTICSLPFLTSFRNPGKSFKSSGVRIHTDRLSLNPPLKLGKGNGSFFLNHNRIFANQRLRLFRASAPGAFTGVVARLSGAAYVHMNL